MGKTEKALKTLNRDIKRLYNDNLNEAMIRIEFKRLYSLDPTFSHMNINSMKIMVRLNADYRIIPNSLFGNEIVIR